MHTYYYRVLYNDYIQFKKKNMNRHVQVYELMLDGTFKFIGELYANSASYVGDKGLVARILSDKLGYTLDDGGYRVIDKDIQIVELP